MMHRAVVKARLCPCPFFYYSSDKTHKSWKHSLNAVISTDSIYMLSFSCRQLHQQLQLQQ